IATCRGAIAAGGRYLAERFVRAVFIVVLSEVIEPLLLSAKAAGRRFCHGLLQGAMHAFMTPVLLRLSRRDAFGSDAKPDPPDGERGQATGGACRKGHTGVRADACRQTILTEPTLEAVPRRRDSGCFEALATDQVAAVLVHHRQWIAPLSVTQQELPLEVR